MLTMKGENMEELTTAESMVMKTIWDHPHEMALQEIMKMTNETLIIFFEYKLRL